MKKHVLSALLLSALLASASVLPALAAPVAADFTDVPAQAYYVPAVDWALEKGVTSGTSETTFSPNGPCTRGQVVTFLWRAQGQPEPSAVSNPFHDVEESSPFYKAILWAAEKGITSGTAADTFSPSDPCTRAQIVTFLWRAEGSPAPAATSALAAEYDEGAYYKTAVQWADSLGLLAGTAQPFTPAAHCPRADVVTYLYRSSDEGAAARQPGPAAPVKLVPMGELQNLKSIRKKCTDEELRQAYDAAAEVVRPLAGMSREDQLYGIALTLRQMFEAGMSYSMETPHYNDPYGYFIVGTASCAGCTRATGLCLNMLGIPYEHVNENQYSHQWCRVPMADGSYWICDAYGLYCGPEPAAYQHPFMS